MGAGGRRLGVPRRAPALRGVLDERRPSRRVGVRIGDQVLDLARLSAGRAGRRSTTAGGRGFRPAVAQRVHGARARALAGRARTALTELVCDPAAQARGRAGARAARRRHLAPADRGGRLRRLLQLDRARHQPGPAVPPRRRAAAAQLASPARRLPRPGGHGRGLGHAGGPSRRAAPSRATVRSCSGPATGSTSSWSWGSWSASRRQPGVRSRSARPPTTSSGSSWSTTGRPATSRCGSTSRWARSSASPSPPPCPPGSRRSRRSRRCHVPVRCRIREPLPYLRLAEPWGLDLDLEVAMRPAGGHQREPAVSRTSVRRACTGGCRSRSPTSPSTARTCAPATCWPRARSRGPSGVARAASSS